ncbi:DNA-deoxyinosine glycosylase [Sphingomonas sp.]|uniref:DNA-deoxyinosine glycosylase n=1 Tax=Sphingomonas sp. TaxID=28214 RepID=UPI000DB610F0|nr:DNA-deoxyinosine glycosylase [Sphingomonas sp.]PZU11030.1 MAG: DNA-deoxyinosine glycosylase [Sphingomonas sp.]
MTIKSAFPPSISSDARLLILGSLPGEESLRQGRYYAHPTNAFWWLMGEVLGEPLPDFPYEARLDRLQANRIGLWDVIASARREGSLDQAIRDAEVRDLAAFVGGLPDLRAVAFNGATSARHGRRQLAGVSGVALMDLPSSSAAHAGMTRAAKRGAWIGLRGFL